MEAAGGLVGRGEAAGGGCGAPLLGKGDGAAPNPEVVDSRS
ncbi:hypothetical protein [Stieleria marina]